MKLSTLVNPQFQVTLRKLAGQDIPLRTAFTLRGIIKRCNEELAKYEEVRISAVNKFGSKKEDGSLDMNEQGGAKLTDENAALFTAELNTLLDTTVSIGSIKASELGEKATLTASDLMLLDEVVAD